jgi:hypothetical protein
MGKTPWTGFVLISNRTGRVKGNMQGGGKR